jgi:sigma-B regulation protein RsbU (phosphoserine phosphatase)
VFCLFAPFSLIFDLANPIGLPWSSLAVWSLFSGLTAVGWAYAFTMNMKFLWLHVPLTFLVAGVFGEGFYARRLEPALAIQAAIAIAVIVLGYVFFVIFISGEGAKTIRLQTEIGLAKQIHDHLVPAIQEVTEHVELYGASSPASEVGGDLLDVHRAQGTTGLYVADVTGHGVPAGVSMGMIKSAIRMKLRDRPALGDLVTGLNDVLSETQRPGTLATLAALEFGGDSRARYALAGHPAILHFRRGSRTLDRLVNRHPPLGVFAGRAYDHAEVEVGAGDLFVILTDGLTEVFDPAGEEFGQERIERIVERSGERALAEIHREILAAARAFGTQLDDQTLLLARVL